MDDIVKTPKPPWSREEFEQKLRDMAKYYHRNHEFHIMMNEGKLDKEAILRLGCQSLLLSYDCLVNDN